MGCGENVVQGGGCIVLIVCTTLGMGGGTHCGKKGVPALDK